jgi:thiamine kinase-like enzyme
MWSSFFSPSSFSSSTTAITCGNQELKKKFMDPTTTTTTQQRKTLQICASAKFSYKNQIPKTPKFVETNKEKLQILAKCQGYKNQNPKHPSL